MKNRPNKQWFAKVPGFEQLKISLFAYPPTRLFACFTLLLLYSLPVAAVMGQTDTCYVMKQDASGFDVASRWPALNAKACKLVAAFDSTDYADSFKVFGFGFYAELEYYDGYSYPEVFLEMKEKVAKKIPYYLLIGRQSDHTGIYTRFWVDLKLPEGGSFMCLDEQKRLNLTNRLQIAANKFRDNHLSFVEGEKALMDVLIWNLQQIIECECHLLQKSSGCDLCPSPSMMGLDLESAGFVSKFVYAITPTNTSSNPGAGIIDSLKRSFKISFSEANAYNGLNGVVISIPDEINESKQKFDAIGLVGKVYILRGKDVCSPLWDQIFEELSNGTYDYIELHVLVQETLSNGTLKSEGLLYSRYYLKEYGTTGNKSPTLVYNALKVLGNAAIDVGVQMIFNLAFDSEVTNFRQAWEKVDPVSAAWSGISSLLPWKNIGKKGQYMKYAVDGFVFALSEARLHPGTFTYLDFGRDWLKGAGIAFLSQLCIGKIGHYYPVIVKGLTKLWGVIPFGSL